MRILFLTPRFPYPPLKGDSLRVYHQLRALSRDHEITLLSLAEESVSEEDYKQVAALCERVVVVPLPRWQAMLNMGMGVLSRQPLQVRYYASAAFKSQLRAILEVEQFDIVHATLIRMLPYVWDLPTPPVVVDLIDSLSLNLSARRREVRGPKKIAYELEYRRVRAYERAVVRRFPELAVSSPADMQVLTCPGSNHITVIPNGVDIERFPFADQEGRDAATLVFTGNMGYPPNEEAVLWFAADVWPLLYKTRPDLRFQVVGTNPSQRVCDLAGKSQGIEVLGEVPDVTTYLHRATLAVCPMRTGSGIQNKVLEAMASGAPVVATRLANRGVRGVPGRDLVVAEDASAFASSVLRLLDDPEMRVLLAQNGRKFVETHYQWEEHARRLTERYRAVLDDGREFASSSTDDGRRQLAVDGGQGALGEKWRSSVRGLVSKRQIEVNQSPTPDTRHPAPQIRNVLMMTDVTGRGGAEKALVDLAVGLDRSRYNVTVCATRTAGNYQPLLDAAGVRTIILNRNSRRDMYKLLGLVRLLRREKIDILHTHLFGSNTWGRLLGKLAGVPVIIAHEHWSSKSQREVWVDRLLYRLSDRILVPSEASKRMVMEMERIPANNISVLYNGVDISHFNPAAGAGCEMRRELGLKCDELVIGTVGRLSPEKGGVDVLIHAVERLRKDHPRARLLIVGDGDLRPELEKLAAETGSNAIFAGTRTDVAHLLSAMDIFVLPSLKEAMPIALLEAMAMGLPSIATTVGGVPEIITDGENGLLVSQGDEAALHGALQRLASDPALMSSLACAGKAHVQATFTLDSMISRVEQMYETLMRTTNGRRQTVI